MIRHHGIRDGAIRNHAIRDDGIRPTVPHGLTGYDDGATLSLTLD